MLKSTVNSIRLYAKLKILQFSPKFVYPALNYKITAALVVYKSDKIVTLKLIVVRCFLCKIFKLALHHIKFFDKKNCRQSELNVKLLMMVHIVCDFSRYTKYLKIVIQLDFHIVMILTRRLQLNIWEILSYQVTIFTPIYFVSETLKL